MKTIALASDSNRERSARIAISRPKPSVRLVPTTSHRRLLRNTSSIAGLEKIERKFCSPTKFVLSESKRLIQRVRSVGRNRNQTSMAIAGPTNRYGSTREPMRVGMRSITQFMTM